MPGTHWESGRLDGRRGPQRLLFGRVYEDSDIEAKAFPSGSRVVCIASAGCTAIDLSENHTVTAVDLNPVQLEYARRRAAGGPAEPGMAERGMALGRRILRLAGWRPALVEAFLQLDDPAVQAGFWRDRLETRRFRFLVDNLLRRSVLRAVYATPLLEVLPAPFGPVLRARMRRCWSRHANRSNPYARALLAGGTQPAGRKAFSPIRFVCADLASFLESRPAGSFDGFSFSNILDGAGPGYRERLFQAASRTGTKGSKVVHRSFAAPGSEVGTNRAGDDRSFLWGIVAAVPLH